MIPQTKTPRHPNPPPLIRISGTHHEMGRQIGEACRTQVQHSIESGRNLLTEAYAQLELTWEGARIQACKYIPFAQQRYPQYVEELTGIAEAANVSFEDVIVVNVMEALTEDALQMTRCTSIAINDDRTANGHVLLAHNEDWVPEDEDDVFIIHAAPDDECPYLAMTYGCLLPNIGFNAYGIAQLCDSVYPNDARIGIPRLVVSRAVLASKTPEKAIRCLISADRAAGYNHLLAHESGELYSVEVSARHFAILYGEDGYILHTNHYLTPDMQQFERQLESQIASRVRYFRALRLVKRQGQHSVKTLQAIQRDHVNFTNSICNHSVDTNDPLDREKTINSMVIDLTAREMHFAWGNPCENPYHTYHLEG
ncbi:MAG: C45 family autoproteolytic acyltransferase/hydrolase [Anaerolineaceae bacterium]|nr:C45 family autoproteolytic acyltransferase/hydrolase [Anaerolineaceae bacterium]